ncbi:MAG: hypothetical protein H7841_14165 [Magnetospirillum sp. WYHS-4]
MLRLISYFVFAVLFVLLTVQNLEPVTAYLLIGRPVEVPLAVVVILSFLAGCIVTVLTVVRKAVKRGGRRQETKLPLPRQGV